MRRRAAAPVLAALLVLSAGCNNPFDPKADVQFVEFFAFPSFEITVYASQLTGTLNLNNWTLNCWFVVKNKVGVNLTSIDIVYTDLAGNEVTAYQTTGGRHFRIAARLEAVTTNNSFDFGEGVQSNVALYVVDRNVITELQSPSYPADGFMFADITFRGVDDNGFDFKMSRRATIKYYQ